MRAIISIGSNIRPAENVRKSLALLSKHVRLLNVSNVYRSPAENRPNHPWFYNCAVMVETDLSAERLRSEVLAPIEADLGRVRTADKFAARTIDLDLVVCLSATNGAPDGTTVAPDVLNHPYVAIPLAELGPELTVGKGGIPLGKAIERAPRDAIEALPDYSAALSRYVNASHPCEKP